MTENTPAQETVETTATILDAIVEERPSLTKEQVLALMGNLSEHRVSKRSGAGGSNLSYLEAWDVKATLIRVFGFGNFSCDLIESDIVKIIPDEKDATKFTVLAKCTMRLTIHATGATYTETAAASQSGRQGVGEVADFALKTAESDALKRAAIYLGTQFGLSLYNSGQTGDVVRVVIEPEQAGFIAEKVAEMAAAKAKVEAEMQESLKTHTTA